MGQVTVKYRPATGAPVITMNLKGDDFEILGEVGCKMFPDVDHSPTARCPAWDAMQRRLAMEKKKK